MKNIPPGVMHEPRPMAWAHLTTTGDIKKLIDENALEILPVDWPDIPKKDPAPIPVDAASTLLRRAYPYIFDCAAYMATHYPDRIKEDELYKSFIMPYDVFLDYCLDDCNELKEELKHELYPLFKGRPAKYIKVSKNRAVFAHPVIISFFHADLKTGKEKRIKNIGHDSKVSMVQVQILKELLSYEQGYINLPKAPYAKIRRIYNKMRNNMQPFLDNKDSYRGTINHMKSIATEKISTEEAARLATVTHAQWNVIEKIEQGGFYKVYLAVKYILANRNAALSEQNYDFLELCSKCAPEYTYKRGGKLYYKDRKGAVRFSILIAGILHKLGPEDMDVIGIEEIRPHEEQNCITVIFNGGRRKK